MSENKLFRQKSIDKISSPEQLNDYIKVVNPGVFLMLTAVILVLAGMVVWGIFGKLETRITVPTVVNQRIATLYVKADDLSEIKLYQDVYIDGDEYYGFVIQYGADSLKAGDVLGDVGLMEAGYDKEDIVYEVHADTDAPDGIFIAEIVVDRVSPMSFLTND